MAGASSGKDTEWPDSLAPIRFAFAPDGGDLLRGVHMDFTRGRSGAGIILSMQIPSWARTDVETFLRERRLPGEGVARQDLARDVADGVDRELADTFDEMLRLDGSARDLEPALPGVVVLKQPGLKVTARFDGSARTGVLDQYVDLPDPTWFSAVFTPQEVLSVWVSRTADGLVAQALHLDRLSPERSYSELRSFSRTGVSPAPSRTSGV